MVNSVISENRRTAYRVRPISTDQLALSLVCENRSHVPNEIADVTFNGANLRFPKDVAPTLAAGEEILISIESPNLNGTTTLPATVVFMGDDDENRLVGLAFDANAELAERGSGAFLELFNRRMAYRGQRGAVTGGLAVAVIALDDTPDKRRPLAVEVCNISTTGVCLDVDAEADDFLRQQAQIDLALRLPGQERPQEIVTQICYRAEVGERFYYGCHFSWDDTRYARIIIEDLREYTLNRFDGALDVAS